jgi:hypothetical protein
MIGLVSSRAGKSGQKAGCGCKGAVVADAATCAPSLFYRKGPVAQNTGSQDSNYSGSKQPWFRSRTSLSHRSVLFLAPVGDGHHGAGPLVVNWTPPSPVNLADSDPTRPELLHVCSGTRNTGHMAQPGPCWSQHPSAAPTNRERRHVSAQNAGATPFLGRKFSASMSIALGYGLRRQTADAQLLF